MLLNQQIAKNVLLTVIGNPLCIKINLFQIMTLSIKREKVCAVCPYLLFYLPSKWRVVRIRKKLKIFVIWKTTSTIFIKCCVHQIKFVVTGPFLYSKLYKHKKYWHTANTYSRLVLNIQIWERFISISNGFQMPDSNTFSAV